MAVTTARADASGTRNLWRDREFLKFWSSETISVFGSQVTVLALPLTAVITLEATASQIGILNASRFAPFLLVILFAGVWVDRHRRRPILIQTNVGRAALLILVPAAAAFSYLTMELLYAVAFLVGTLTVFFDLAYQSYVPSLVGRGQLTGANSRLEASRAAAEVGGPGVGAVLIELVTAPVALVADAVSFAVSAVALGTMRAKEPEIPRDPARPSTRKAIGEGFRFTFSNRYLRPIAGEAATFNLFDQAIMTVFVVYAVRELDLRPALLGLILSLAAAGAFVGAAAARYPERRFGVGPTIVGSMFVGCTLPLVLPFIEGSHTTLVAAFGATFFGWGLAIAISNVHVVSLRQATTPHALLGRMNASYRFFTYGAIPLGALLGGFLGEIIGLRETLFVGSVGLLVAFLWVGLSDVPRLRELPEAEDGAVEATAPPPADSAPTQEGP